jgi:Asp-tRNA(Asn)/Glu-tRNA(Gln) amidotransferase A subunit family amidase
MVPAAIGTQVGGSIIRPAAYCGNFALKPTQGGINRGERLATSQSTHGPHAGCLEDMWQVAIEMAKRCGGDRGSLGLMGPDTLPAAIKPNRLIVLETEGWADLDAATKAGFAQLLSQLEAAGVTLIRRADHPFVEALETAIANGRAICNGVTSWENRWYQRGMLDAAPDGISARGQATIAKAEAMTPDDYRTGLLARQQAQLAHMAVASLADAALTLSCPGPAPLWSGDVAGQPLAPRPTGDFVFNAPSSMLFAPVVTVPLMSVGGLPVGVQLMGQQHDDARMTGLARWFSENLKRVAVPG